MLQRLTLMWEEFIFTSCMSTVWSFRPYCISESKRLAASKDAESEQDLHDLTVLKSLADGQKSKGTSEGPPEKEDQYVPDESDSTKSRRLAEDYDSTKNGMDDGKYQGTHTCTLERRKRSMQERDVTPPPRQALQGWKLRPCYCTSFFSSRWTLVYTQTATIPFELIWEFTRNPIIFRYVHRSGACRFHGISTHFTVFACNLIQSSV